MKPPLRASHVLGSIQYCPKLLGDALADNAVSLTNHPWLMDSLGIVWEETQLNRDFKCDHSGAQKWAQGFAAGGPILCNQIWHGGVLPLGQRCGIGCAELLGTAENMM